MTVSAAYLWQHKRHETFVSVPFIAPIHASMCIPVRTLWSTLLVITLSTSCRAQGTVRLGVLVPVNGSEAALAVDIVNGANLALVNQSRIKLTTVNTDCGGTLIANAVKDLASKGYVGGIGDLCSGSTLKAASYLNESKSSFVLISPASTSPLVTTAGPYIFRTSQSDIAQGAKLAGIIGKRNAALVFRDEPYGVGLAAVIANRVEATGGSIVWAEAIPSNDTETSVVELLDLKPQVVVIAINNQKAAREVLMLLDEYKYDGVVWGSDALASTSLVVASDGAAENLHLKVVTPRTGSPAFNAAFVRAYGKPPTSAFAAYSYDAALAFQRAIAAINGTVTAAKLASRLLTLPAFTGATGTVRFDANGDRLFAAYECLTAVNGTFVPLVC